MGKIREPNRLRVEDFPEESKALIQKLAPGINNFQDDIVGVINGGKLDFDNLNRQKADFDVITDSSSNLQASIPIKLNLRTKPYGINIVRIINVNAPGTLPNYMPLIAFTFSDSILTITTIKGLTPSAKYHLYIEIVGT